MNNCMKQNIISLITFCGLVFSSCSMQENLKPEIPSGMGSLNIQPTAETDIQIPVITTRSSELFPEQDVNTYYLSITGETNKEYDQFSDLIDEGLPLELPVGDYSITVSSFKRDGVSISEKPYFLKTESFKIEDKTTTNLSLKCTFESIGVIVKPSEEFQKLLDDESTSLSYAFEADVYNGDSDVKLSFYQWKNDGEAVNKKLDPGYFLDAPKSGKLKVKVRVRLKSTNTWYPERTYYLDNNGQPADLGQYYIITIDAGPHVQETQTLKAAVEEDGK